MGGNPNLSIRIITGPECDNKELFVLEKEFAGRFETIQTRVRPRLHFRVIDNRDLFIERYHDHGNSHRIVDMYEYELFKAAEYQKKFEKCWNENMTSQPSSGRQLLAGI
jgi:hypothetical protein